MKKSLNFDVANFVTSSLPDYVAENRDLLIADIALGSSTLERVSIQTGVKYKSPIHLLDFDANLQAMGCDASAQDNNLAFTDREITTAVMGHLVPICEDNLLGKWGEYAVRITASDEELAFEQYVMDAIISNVHNKVEKLIWQGDTSAVTPDLIDGYITIAGDDVPVAQQLSLAAGTSAYDGVMAAYMALPEEALAHDNVEIYVSPAIFRTFMADLVSANLFHFNPNDATAEEVFLPGTAAKVVKRAGLTGSLAIIATYAKNLYYGTDLENAKEDVAVFYEKKEDKFYAKVKFNAGVQIAFPDRAVLATFAAAPVAIPTIAAGVQAVAAAVATCNEGE